MAYNFSPDMEDLYLFRDNQRVGAVKADPAGPIRLILEDGINESVRSDISRVFRNPMLDLSLEARMKTLQKDFEDKGYTVLTEDPISQNELERREASPEQKKEARFIHESNLIENITEIPYEDILKSLRSGDVGGHVSAWRFTKALGHNRAPLMPEHVCLMQKYLTDEQSEFAPHYLEPKYRGAIRDCLVSIGGHVVAPPTEEDFRNFFRHLNEELQKFKSSKIEEILRFAAKSHLEYEAMHPFADGNGRTGRLIVNYILAYFGYTPLIFTNADKTSYYRGFNNLDSETMENYFLSKYQENSN